jgi:hypothetical protein
MKRRERYSPCRVISTNTKFGLTDSQMGVGKVSGVPGIMPGVFYLDESSPLMR